MEIRIGSFGPHRSRGKHVEKGCPDLIWLNVYPEIHPIPSGQARRNPPPVTRKRADSLAIHGGDPRRRLARTDHGRDLPTYERLEGSIPTQPVPETSTVETETCR